MNQKNTKLKKRTKNIINIIEEDELRKETLTDEKMVLVNRKKSKC